MTIYKPYEDNPLKSFSFGDMVNNQRVLSGTNPELSSTKGSFFLETLIIESGKSVTIKDGKGQTIASGVTSFESAINPLRCDYGIFFTGDVVFAKGFIAENILK